MSSKSASYTNTKYFFEGGETEDSKQYGDPTASRENRREQGAKAHSIADDINTEMDNEQIIEESETEEEDKETR